MKQFPKRLISSLVSLTAIPSLAIGADLLSLYKKAENYDAEIFAAKSAFLAEREGENIAFGQLLPSLNASASINYTDTDYENSPPNDDSFKTRSYSVGLSQPLLNFSAWYDVTAAEQRTLQAETTFLAAQQNLILEVASAYFGVLRTEENLRSAKSQEAAVKRQYEQAKEQFDVGLIAITDVHEAKASYDASQTLRIRSEGDLTVARENLSRITGEYSDELETLKADFPILMDKNTSAEQWAASAFENNLNIKIAEFALNSVQQNLKSSQSNHLPTLSLDAGYSNNEYSNSALNDNDPESTNVALVLTFHFTQAAQLRRMLEKLDT